MSSSIGQHRALLLKVQGHCPRGGSALEGAHDSSQHWPCSHTTESVGVKEQSLGNSPGTHGQRTENCYTLSRTWGFSWGLENKSGWFSFKVCWFSAPLPFLATSMGTKLRSAGGTAMFFLASIWAASAINLSRKAMLVGLPEPIYQFVEIWSFRQTAEP